VGPNGKIQAFVPGPSRFWNLDNGPQPVPHVIVSPRNPTGPQRHDVPVDPQLLEAGDHNGATYYQHRQFLDTVRNGRQPEVTLADGAMAVRMGLAAQEAALTGRAVTL
jgi:predicted dehydrogenase